MAPPGTITKRADRGPFRRTGVTTAAGLCYLAVVGGGLFAQGVVRGPLVVPGDAVATTQAIAENEGLWRLGIAVHLLYLLPALAMKVLVTGLFRRDDAMLARLALVFGVAAVTIEAMSLVALQVPLVLGAAPGTLADPGDRPALVYLATQSFSTGFGFSLMLFSGFCVGVGVLIVRSRRLPRAIGVLMIVAGVCYVVNTLALIVSPPFYQAINPAILAPILIAELSLALWLLAKGVATEPPRDGTTSPA